MNTIKFSHNWNGKLNQKVFTTIRNHTVEKYYYYLNATGSMFNVWLKGSGNINTVELIDVSAFVYNDIPFPLIATDTGIKTALEATILFKKFGMKSMQAKMIVLTFAVTKEQ